MSKQENRLSRIKVFCWVIYQLELVTQSKQMHAPLPIGIGNLESVQPPSNLRLVSLLTAINRSHRPPSLCRSWACCFNAQSCSQLYLRISQFRFTLGNSCI